MNRFIATALFFALAVFAATAGYGGEDTFTLQGVVSTLSGEPVPDAEVYLYSSRNSRRPADFISPKSDKNGAYRLVLPRATYWGVARIKKGERFGPLLPGDKHSGEPVQIDPDREKTLTLDFTVADMQELAQRREKGREELPEISGTVTSNGTAVAGAYVYARVGRISATLPEYFSAWTDSAGRYTLKLPAGGYFLGAERTFPPAGGNTNLQEITLPVGKLPVVINVPLPVE